MTDQTINQIRTGIAVRSTVMDMGDLLYEVLAADRDAADIKVLLDRAAARRRRSGNPPTLRDRDIARAWIDAVLVATEWHIAAEQRSAGRRAAA